MALRADGAELNDACRERKRGVAKRLIAAKANLMYTNVRLPSAATLGLAASRPA